MKLKTEARTLKSAGWRNKKCSCGHDKFFNIKIFKNYDSNGEWESAEITATCAWCDKDFWDQVN